VNDTERIDWLEKTKHVICYNNGIWFCAWRGSLDNNEFWNWTDRPGAVSLRDAIDHALEEHKSDHPRR